MPAKVISGFYNLQFGLVYPPGVNMPTPKPSYLTNNGEGKQLTIEDPTGNFNQEWQIQPPLTGRTENSGDLIIIPAMPESMDAVAVSQDVVSYPDQVSLIKNLQVWNFELIRESDQLYVLRSNLYTGLVGSDPLLGVDKEYKKVIIDHIPVVENPPPRPVWQLIGPLNK